MNQGQLEGRLATLESRMASLETHNTIANPRLDRIEEKLGNLTERIAKLEERVSHVPSKEMIVTIALGTIGAISAVAAFLGKIQKFLGTTP